MNYPKRVTIELTNKCNRFCTECPRHNMTGKQGFMTVDLFKKIVDQLPKETIIVPFFRGEPLLHPNFPQLMSMLSKFDTVQIATNGDLIDEWSTHDLMDNCTFVSVSLHGRLSPTKKLTRFFLECSHYGVTTQVSVLDSQVEGCKSVFLKDWSMVDRVRIYKTHSKHGFGSLSGEVRWPRVPCEKPFTETLVYWDGRVGLCNHDWNNQTYLGDLNTQSLKEVLLGDELSEVCRYHVTGSRTEVESCKHCDFVPNVMQGELYN